MLSMSDAVPALGAFVWELRGKPGWGGAHNPTFDRGNAIEVNQQDLIKAFVRKYPAFAHLSVALLDCDQFPCEILKTQWEAETKGMS